MMEGADETWRQDGFNTFTLTTLFPDRLLFGFRVKYGLDNQAPDPIYNVKVDRRAKTASLVLVDTLMGYRQVTAKTRDGDTADAINLLTEMRLRRRDGGVEVERFCHWAKEAA